MRNELTKHSENRPLAAVVVNAMLAIEDLALATVASETPPNWLRAGWKVSCVQLDSRCRTSASPLLAISVRRGSANARTWPREVSGCGAVMPHPIPGA